MAQNVRTFWKGYLRLALVAIPVRLVSAEISQATPHFHQIDRKSKQRIHYLKVADDKKVAPDDIVMGYEVEPGDYVLLEKDELDAVKLETRHAIELTQFVDAADIDPLYFERPYYLLPDGDVAEEGYVVIRDADDVFASLGKAKPRADMLEMAKQLIDSRSHAFDPSEFKNHYAEALRDLVKRKVESGGKVSVEEESEPRSKVIDFMEALKRSLGSGSAPAPPAKPPAKPAAKPKPSAKPKSAAKKAAPKRKAS